MTDRSDAHRSDSRGSSLLRWAWQQVWRQGRRLGRLAAFVGVAAGYTLYAGIAVRLKPEGQPRVRATARHQQRGARLLLRILGVRAVLVGRTEALAEERPALLACNHLGLLDPFVLAARLRMALVGKAEIAGWPAAGWVARTMGVVFVKRDRTHGVEGFAQRVRERLEHGVNVLAFPEGTTNADPQVRPFKTGVFLGVAEHDEATVVPLYLHVRSIGGEAATGARRQQVIWAGGSASALVHAWRLLALPRVTMEVRVGTPIAAKERGRKELARRAQEQVEAMAAEALAA